MIKSADIYDDRSKSSGYNKMMYNNLIDGYNKYFVFNTNCVTAVTDAIYSSLDNPEEKLHFYDFDNGMDRYAVAEGVFYPPFMRDGLIRAFNNNTFVMTVNNYKPGAY